MLTQKKYFPFFMWFFPVIFFTYQFILRLWPGLMIHQIMDQFSIDASHFGVLAALYYYGYAGMQIPVAMLLDRFHPRYVIFAFAILCGVGTFVFSYTDNWYLACMSRFLVGVGSAVGFLGASKVISEWFPKDRYARMIGFSFTVGLMGAIYGGKPVSVLIEAYSWRNVALALSLISIVIGCSAYLFLRSRAYEALSTAEEDAFKVSHFKALLSSPIIWLLAFANLLMVGSLEGGADVWCVPYLMTAYALNKGEAAQLVSFVFIGMLFGGPVLALCSKKWGDYTVIALCGFGMALAFVLLLLTRQYNWWWLASLFFAVGVMCCYQVIVFAAGSDLINPQLLGVTVAFLNFINMLGGSFFHTSIGRIMDVFWTGSVNTAGGRQYTLESYQAALTLIPICAVLGAVIVCALGWKLKRRGVIESIS